MLGIIRDKITGWIAGIIVGLLIISFAFWGISFYTGQGKDAIVASVNDQDIKLQNFQRSFYNFRQEMKPILGGQLSPQEDEFIKEQALQQLINTEIINQLVKDNDLRVTDEQMLSTIQSFESFHDEDGGFDRIKYEQSMLSLGIRPQYFEQQLRMTLLSEQLQAGLSETVFVIDSELEALLQLKLQARDITYGIIAGDHYIDNIEISDNDIEDYYALNKDKYAKPEQVRIAYIELDVEKIAKTVEVDDSTLVNYYKNNKANYDIAEQRSLTKLFVKTGEEATEKDKNKAKRVIESALALVKEGRTFEEIVKQFTDDEKKSLEFSEHSFISKGVFDEKIDAFLFSSDQNAISDIIETKNGFNIIKVNGVRGGPKNTYDNVAEQVENDYKYAQAELQFFELFDQLTTLSYEHEDSLEPAAETTGQSIQETDFFSRNSTTEGLLANEKIISVSFTPELINSGANSDVIELADDHIVVLRVLEHKLPAIKPLAEIREKMVAALRSKKSIEKAKQIGQSIVEQFESGKAKETIIGDTDVNIEWFTAEDVKRDEVDINRSVLRKAFQLGKPAEGKQLIAGHSLGSGDYAVIIVAAVSGHSTEAIAEDINQKTDIELKLTHGKTEWQMFLRNARNNADVTVFRDNI